MTDATRPHIQLQIPIDSPWDRKWNHFAASAVLAGDPDGPAVSASGPDIQFLDNWRGHLIELPSPIFARTDLTEIINVSNARIYPPFKLNHNSANDALFTDVVVPVGAEMLTTRLPIPGHAVKGMASEVNSDEKGGPLTGLRIDCSTDTEIDRLVSYILGVVRLYAHQWWVPTQRNPFDAGIRMSFKMIADFTPGDVPAIRGRDNIESPWLGNASTQNLIGLEKVLDADIWTNVGRHLRQSLPLDNGLSFFFDAVNDYMGFQDDECVMHLALAYEVCENKARLMDGQKPRTKNKQLLSQPTLSRGKLGAIFRKLITDRDNIAHGRSPYHLSQDPDLIREYLSAGLELAQLYNAKCTEFGWVEALKLSLGRN